MGSSSGLSGDIIGSIVVVKVPSTLKVTCNGGSSYNGIFMEKANGEGAVPVVYCYCCDALLGIRRT